MEKGRMSKSRTMTAAEAQEKEEDVKSENDLPRLTEDIKSRKDFGQSESDEEDEDVELRPSQMIDLWKKLKDLISN